MAFLKAKTIAHPLTRRLLSVAILGLTLGAPDGLSAADANPKEHQIKAIFVFNFIQFTAWPESAFASPRAPIRIGVLGDDPLADALDTAVKGERIGNRSVTIERRERLQDLKACHVVVVCRSESAQASSAIAAFAGKPVLTIGDLPDFARRGGIINFYLDGQRVRFEINRAAAELNGCKLASQLLGLARIVGPPVEQGGR